MAEEPANWGDSISVVCAVLKGDLPIDVSWALNGEPIERNHLDINIVATTKKNSILSIESVAARHAGEYTCTASNRAGATSQSATLAVNGTFPLLPVLLLLPAKPPVQNFRTFLTRPAFDLPLAFVYTHFSSKFGHNFKVAIFLPVAPQIAPFVIGEEPANWGDTVTATCTVIKGDYPIEIEWALNGKPIVSSYPDISIVSTSKRVSLLTIDSVSASHAGEYTCTASNAAGGTSCSASLAVNGIAKALYTFYRPLVR